MASAPANDSPPVDTSNLFGAEVVDSVLLIPTRDIELGERLRAVDPVWAAALGQLMGRDGQQTPIEVCRLPGRTSWTIVAGGHRYEGARAEGIEYLRAIVVTANRDDRRLREVNENLWRKDLDAIDRAAFMAEAVSIYKRRAGVDADAKRVAMVRTGHLSEIEAEADDLLDTMSSKYGWSEEVGEQLGFASRTIRRDLYLCRRLAPSLVARLREGRHAVARNATQLRALAKLEPKVQAEVVDALIGENGWEPCRTVAEAVKRTQPAKAGSAGADDNKRLSAFLGAFQRMTISERKGALALLAEHVPAGFAIVDHARYRDEALAQIDEVRELIDGLEEDEAIPGDRGYDLYAAGRRLALARMSIVSNVIPLAAPVDVAAGEAVDLGQAIAAVSALKAQALDPDYIIGELRRRFGARARVTASGASELLLANVYADSADGGEALIRAWIAAADRRLSAGER